MSEISSHRIFKSCAFCKKSWKSRDEFLSDTDITLLGYQPHFKNMEEGLFLFNHQVCTSTLSIISHKLRDLYTGPLYTSDKFNSDKLNYDDCPDFCLFKYKMQGCLQQCERAFVSEVIQIITMWKKEEKVLEQEKDQETKGL
jgi:hypothetical protein